MSDEIKYTQDETGARTFSFTLTPEQLASDQFLGDIKDGADLIKSWESQKSMIGAKMIPSENATDAEWAKYYEKTRPSDGKYGLEDESLEKFASDNGLTKKQAAAVAARIKEVTTLGEDEIGAEALDKQLSAAFGEKVGEVVAQVNEVMKLSWSEEENKSFEKLPNSMQVLVAKGFKAVLDKFGVKAADFRHGFFSQGGCRGHSYGTGYPLRKPGACASVRALAVFAP